MLVIPLGCSRGIRRTLDTDELVAIFMIEAGPASFK